MTTTTGNGPPSAAVTADWQDAGHDVQYCKFNFYGKQGSGKSYQAAVVAREVAKRTGQREVYMIDSESGSDFVADLFQVDGITLKVLKTREFSVMVDRIKALPSGAIVIIDSTTHYWQSVVNGYLAACRPPKQDVELKDWGPITKYWDKEFTTFYVNSPLHIMLCGRLRYEYDSTVNEKGKLEFYRADTKMGAGGDIGYESNLIAHVAQVDNASAQLELHHTVSKEERAKTMDAIRHGLAIDFVLTIEKDRQRKLQGKRFVFQPTGDDAKDTEAVAAIFRPNIQWLLGNASHRGIQDAGETTERLADIVPTTEGLRQWKQDERKRAIALEELEGQMLKFFPGAQGKDKAMKIAVLEEQLGTRSWTKISEELPLATLETLVFRNGQPSTLERACQAAVDAELAAKIKTEEATPAATPTAKPKAKKEATA